MIQPSTLRVSRNTTNAFKLHLSPINYATFAFCILFGVWSLFQVLRCIRVLRKKGTHIISYTILLFAILFTLVYHIMSAAEIVKDYNLVPSSEYPYTQAEVEQIYVQPLLKPLFYTMWNWVYFQADVLLAAALLVHVLQRASVFSQETSSPPAFPSWKQYIDGALVVIWTALMIACLVIYDSLDKATSANALFHARETYRSLKYARLAFQIITTFDITASSVFLWLQTRKANYSDKHITYVAGIISPLLLVHAFYLMAIAIVEAQPLSFTYKIDYDALNLASTILEGLLNYGAIYMFLEGATQRLHEKKRSFYDD